MVKISSKCADIYGPHMQQQIKQQKYPKLTPDFPCFRSLCNFTVVGNIPLNKIVDCET